jgi:putative membrane protein
MELRWILAAGHLLGLAIGVGGVWARAGALSGTLDAKGIGRVLAADNWWGLSALLLIGTGLIRLFGSYEKSVDYYAGNSFFWIKMALLIAIVLLELAPMITFIRWRMAGAPNKPITIDATRVPLFATISRIQAVLLVAMILMATGMARGLGL